MRTSPLSIFFFEKNNLQSLKFAGNTKCPVSDATRIVCLLHNPAQILSNTINISMCILYKLFLRTYYSYVSVYMSLRASFVCSACGGKQRGQISWDWSHGQLEPPAVGAGSNLRAVSLASGSHCVAQNDLMMNWISCLRFLSVETQVYAATPGSFYSFKCK